MDVAVIRSGQDHARLRLPRGDATPLAPEDPAVRVFTDFTKQQPVTVTEHVPLDDALNLMKFAGVRALIVMREEAIVGLITSYDIQGERAVRYQQSASHIAHKDVEVGDIMTPWSQVPVVELRWIAGAHVKEVAELFRRLEATHLVVVEHAEGTLFARGLLSRTPLLPLIR